MHSRRRGLFYYQYYYYYYRNLTGRFVDRYLVDFSKNSLSKESLNQSEREDQAAAWNQQRNNQTESVRCQVWKLVCFLYLRRTVHNAQNVVQLKITS